MMKQLQSTSLLAGGNAPYLEAIYEAYLRDPNAVDEAWQALIDRRQSGLVLELGAGRRPAATNLLAQQVRQGPRLRPPRRPG